MKIFKLVMAIMFTILTVIGAQVNISLPISPVPFILSDFFIILGALYLGSKLAVFSTGLYLFLGALGLPFFSDGAGGIEHFTGPTGGYLIGFLIAAYAIGLISEKKPRSVSKDILAWLAGAVCIFSFGILGLILFAEMDINSATQAGFIPFIPAATIKGLVAVGITQLLRKISLGNYGSD